MLNDVVQLHDSHNVQAFRSSAQSHNMLNSLDLNKESYETVLLLHDRLDAIAQSAAFLSIPVRFGFADARCIILYFFGTLD